MHFDRNHRIIPHLYTTSGAYHRWVWWTVVVAIVRMVVVVKASPNCHLLTC